MKGRPIPYSEAELVWIRANSRRPRYEAQQEFCERFARDVSLSNFNALCKRKGWLTGKTGYFVKGGVPHNKGLSMPSHPNSRRTQFKKGAAPANRKYIGHERVVSGYVEVSVAETNPHTGASRRYVAKHRREWELVNGPIPKGHVLKCLTGDTLDCDPSNWACVPRAILPILNGGRFKTRLAFDEAPDELKPMVLAAAKLRHKTAEVAK